MRVTNTNDSGVGSLRHAIENEKGPRIIVFTVGGTISLSKEIVLKGEDDSFVSILGQTAPGGGIQLKNYGVLIYNDGESATAPHDIIIRYLRLRVGQRADYNFADDNDSQEVWGEPKTIYNVVFDHISAQWALDENMSIWGSARDITYQYNLIAEASMLGQDTDVANNEYHPAKGLLIGTDNASRVPDNISMHHNVFAHNAERNPRLFARNADFRNNYIYNWGNNNSTALGDYKQLGIETNFNVINNIWKAGPSTSTGDLSALWVNPKTKVYLEGNRSPKCPNGCADQWQLGFRNDYNPYAYPSSSGHVVGQAFSFPAVTTHSTTELLGYLESRVGASKPVRDGVDTKILNDLKNGTGQTGINSSFPVLSAGTTPTDSDQDGIPDSWEQANGLNPNDGSDSRVISPSGYAWIEVYANSLVE